MSAYTKYQEECPYCNAPCECEWVDVGVGLQQCGPYHCDQCGAREMGTDSYEGKNKNKANPEEIRIGWYRGDTVLLVISEEASEVAGLESLTYGSNHPYTCRCKVCLKWWVNCGLEKVGDNEYRCGPFAIAEFLAAGGRMPERFDSERN